MRQLHQLPAMVEGKDEQLPPLFARHADLVQALQHGVLVRTGNRHRAVEQVIQFGAGRHRRGASMARHHQAAAGVGQLAAALIAGVLQPATEEARHKGITGTQHIEHLYLHARINHAVFKSCRNRAVNHRAALRAELDHQGCSTQAPDVT